MELPVERGQVSTIRRCGGCDFDDILHIINAAAISYRGVIPPEHWHEPYMTALQLEREIAAGVEFWACVRDERIAGVMGLQAVRDVDLIRHAYVLPAYQSQGVGSQMLTGLRQRSRRRLLIGTWAAAKDAIRFYERNGFAVVPEAQARRLLRRYWDVPAAQIANSVVLEPSGRRSDASLRALAV